MGAGFYIDPENTFGLKAGDEILTESQKENWVDYAGPLAGRPVGLFFTPGGRRILITSAALPVKPKRMATPGLDKYFGELFGADQTPHVLAWLKIALETLRKGSFRPGQLLVLAGPPGCGKSFFHVLCTQLFGGRSAKPYRYMTGRTNFNSDLAGAEHLIIEDENASASITARREFGTAIKDWTVNEEISVHAKGREAITLGFFRRLTLSVNNEPENLMILPPMDGSILDKVMLFNCSPALLSDDRWKNIEMLMTELPGLAYDLERLKIGRELRDARFGVRAFHNPELLEILTAISPEHRLENLIDEVLKWDKQPDKHCWRGTAEELERELRDSPFAFAVERLVYYSSAMGTYLARLARKNPERYSSVINRGRTQWLIKKGE